MHERSTRVVNKVSRRKTWQRHRLCLPARTRCSLNYDLLNHVHKNRINQRQKNVFLIRTRARVGGAGNDFERKIPLCLCHARCRRRFLLTNSIGASDKKPKANPHRQLSIISRSILPLLPRTVVSGISIETRSLLNPCGVSCCLIEMFSSPSTEKCNPNFYLLFRRHSTPNGFIKNSFASPIDLLAALCEP